MEDDGYSVAIICTTLSMVVLIPMIVYLYDPLESDQVSAFDQRSISQVRSSDMLRVLTCIHSQDPVPYMINLLDTLNAADVGVTINVYMMNLVELQGRALPMLISHASSEDAKDPVIKAFRNYNNHTNGRVRLKMYTSVSPYRSMQIDIRKIAEENLVSVIIFSFCKKEKIGKADYAMRTMTPMLINNSNCSVGILIHDIPIYGQPIHRIGVVFWGGPDDRDALAFASFMANREGVTVTVHRYMQIVHDQSQVDTRVDDDAILEFKSRTIRSSPNNNNSNSQQMVSVIETMVTDKAQTINNIITFGQNYDLLIVGHTQQALSNVMTEWSDFPELGVFGDMFASSTTSRTCPVLVLHCNQTEM